MPSAIPENAHCIDSATRRGPKEKKMFSAWHSRHRSGDRRKAASVRIADAAKTIVNVW
jgi:hypothetical protein